MTDPSPPDFAVWDEEFRDLQVDDHIQNDRRDGYFTRPELSAHFGCKANSSRFGTLLKQLKEQGRLLTRRTYRMDSSGRRFPLKAFKILPPPSPKVTITEGFPSHDPAIHIHVTDEPIVGSTPRRVGDTLITPTQDAIPCPEHPSQPQSHHVSFKPSSSSPST